MRIRRFETELVIFLSEEDKNLEEFERKTEEITERIRQVLEKSRINYMIMKEPIKVRTEEWIEF